MRLDCVILENRHLRLEPLGESHREALRAACSADAEIWRALYPVSMLGVHFDPRFDTLVADLQAGRAHPYAALSKGRVVGLSCHLAIDAQNASVEIGSTYFEPASRGGCVNPASKLLLLGHAFDAGARRVAFRVDALNQRSQAAVTKLGAVREGLLRQDRVVWTGRVRDTAVFSILKEEWPAIRRRLETRLQGDALR